MAERDSKQLTWAGILLAALLGIVLMIFITRWGIGTSPDSISYIGGSRTLLAGEGLMNAYGEDVGTPMTFRAPLYPFLLSGLALTGLTPLSAARWLNVIIFAANIILVGRLIFSVLRDSHWLPLLGAVLVLTSLPMINIHAFAWTEPLFILLAFSGFLLLDDGLQKENLFLILLAAVLMGLAVVTRYAGFPLIAVGGLGILLFSTVGYGRRLRQAVLFGLVAALPFALWTVRNMVVAGNSAGREIAFHPFNMTHVRQLVFTLSGWLQLPDFLPNLVRLAVLGLVFGGLLLLLVWPLFAKNSGAGETAVPVLVKLLVLFVLVYMAFLVLSISFVDANTPLDDRILSPVFVACVVLFMYALSVLWQMITDRGDQTPEARPPAGQKRWSLIILVVLGVAFLGTAVWRELNWIRAETGQGLGFTGLAWQQSDINAYIAQLPDDLPIYSNVPEAIYLHTEKSALSFPRKINVTTQRVEADYTAQMALIRQELLQEQGVIVFFSTLRQDARETITEIESELPLTISFEAADGLVYTAAPD